MWIGVIAARTAFSYGSSHWFGSQLHTWMTQHAVTSAAITDALLFMAIAMILTRSIALAVRARSPRTDSSIELRGRTTDVIQ